MASSSSSPSTENSKNNKNSNNNNNNNNNKPNQRIEHITEIDAPIETVWKALIDVNDGWPQWNKWTLLCVDCDDAAVAGTGTPLPATTGLQGTLKACYEGDDQDWNEFPFEFAEVNHDNHILAWKGRGAGDGCLFRGYHVMRLEEIIVNNPMRINGDVGKKRTTRLLHTEQFGGLLPFLNMALPYDTLDRNYRLMNESLKAFVEEEQQKKE